MEEKNILYQSDTESKTIFDRTISYLYGKYDLRYNTISLEYEIKYKASEIWNNLNINSLYIELVQSGIEIPINKLEILIKSHLIDQYNPIREYFSKLPKWDNINHIHELASHVQTTDDPDFTYHLEKWFTRAVLCALEKGKINKQCLVLANSLQNTGKTSFLRYFIPQSLEKYYTENISVDKDGIIAICNNLICNADELAILSKSDVNTLKAFISKSNANVRLPYGRKAEYLERICSFVGSTNRTDFLNDESGSVRWLVFEVKKINFDYSKNIDIDKVWSQAFYNAYERKNYNPELTAIDIVENEKRNEKFKLLSMEQEILMQHFDHSEDENKFLTSTDIMIAMNNAIGIKMSSIKIGKALMALNFKRIKHSKRQIYGYLIFRRE